jgi:SPP1 gp7 family putative phage head morphogenesis protein
MAINSNTELYDKALDRAAMMRSHEKQITEKVIAIIGAHENRIDSIFSEAKQDPRKAKTLRADLDAEVQLAHKQTYSITKRALLDLVGDQITATYQNIYKIMGRVWITERPQKRISESIVLEKPLIQNKTLEAGWLGISQLERQRISDIIRKGIAKGNSYDDMEKEIRTVSNKITRNQANGLVVTAVTSVMAQADHAVYEANTKALNGWQYVAVLDSRTTPLCASRDGHIYPLDRKDMLPPAHYYCRSTTIPVFKSWSDLDKLEGVANVRKQNIERLTPEQRKYYDGLTPLKESYNDWLLRQSPDVQLRHLGDYNKVALFQSRQVSLDSFVDPSGQSRSLAQVRAITDSGYTLPNDTLRFANAKAKLDAMQLGASRVEDLYDRRIKQTLIDYYKLQAGELDGTLSLTNYRGIVLQSKKAIKNKVLTSPPAEDQMKFNPVTGRYEDIRMYQPAPSVLANNLRLLDEDKNLTEEDKAYVKSINDSLEGYMSLNERAVVVDNLRITMSRQRASNEVWVNFKAVTQSQMKFDVMNVSDAIETQIRRDSDVLKKLKQDNYIDPVLGATQLDELHDNFLSNIRAKNRWEDTVAPKIARELQGALDPLFSPIPSLNIDKAFKMNPLIWQRMSERDFQKFYLRFAQRLAMADSPDRDQLAVSLGRDLYNAAGINGSRNKWYDTGMAILTSKEVEPFVKLETFGVQKRRMKSKLSGSYFGPYYDTLAHNIRVIDPRIQEYAQLTRKVDLGLRVAVTTDANRLVFRKHYKTYFINNGITLEDTRIPITSTNSFSDFPEEFVDDSLTDALNWAAQAEYRIDPEFYDFVIKLLYFEDDKGKAKYYNELNEYRKYMASRGDAYERLKSMEWLRNSGKAFSNHPFVDHRARIYDRGLISPQSGESFRPFLNTKEEKAFSELDYVNFQDQVGAFLGGLSDFFEGNYNSLTVSGRQAIALKWRPEIVKLGQSMLRAKPNDIRAVLDHPIMHQVEGEELGKFMRFAMESAKIDNYLKGDYSRKSLKSLTEYKTALALEQDASSSGAQIIALTTRNKQLAELSNVVSTTQKRRLYDEIAASTYNDPRFRALNAKLGLTEKDLRKAAKAQNMVVFYGAGERTGIMNVEAKLGKVLGKDSGTLVVKASDRDTVLNEISARAARYKDFDPALYNDLMQLRKDVKDIFDKGLDPGEDIIEQLYFLQPQTKDLLEKMTRAYDRVVTPEDFKQIAQIMSENLSSQVPILKDFTKFFGRLAEDYLKHSDPSSSAIDWKAIAVETIRGRESKGYTLPDRISELLGLPAGKPISQQLLERLPNWDPQGTLYTLMFGSPESQNRRTGFKFMKVELKVPSIDLKNATFGKDIKLFELSLFNSNKLPKSWTNVPWVNFDGGVIEQNFTQTFEERLRYQNPDGTWTTNILQIPNKTEASWWDEATGASGKINDIADVSKARTAFAVNGNHSNDAVIVKKFHLWGKQEGVSTSTIHDAFFANAADMLKARKALRSIYADVLSKNVIVMTLNEMRARGLPKDLYEQYMNEAIQKGLIPIAGKSVVGGITLKDSDILTIEDILAPIKEDFSSDRYWYGVG